MSGCANFVGMEFDMNKLPIGVYDDPKNQKQALFELDLQKSNTIVFGSAMSGKTTFIKNILVKMHEMYSPQEENVYIIDFSGALLRYKDLGFICACFDNSNEENIRRLFNKLENTLHSNTRLLSGINFPEYKKDNKPAHTTFIIENFNGFLMDKRYESYQEKLLKLCREGLSKGITIILTVADTSGGVNQYIGGFGQRVAFDMPADKLIDIFNTKANPPMNLQGRGLANIENQIFEFQGFLPFQDEDDEYDNFIEAINKKLKSSDIPKLVSFDGELNSQNFEEYSAGHQSIDDINSSAGHFCPVTVGLDYYDMKPVTVDLLKTPSIGIYGKRQSGKTNLLWLIIESAINLKNEKGLRFVLFDDGRKQLGTIAKYLNEKELDVSVITQVTEMKDYLFNKKYYKTEYDDYQLKDNPFTVFVIQNKSTYTGKADELMRKIFPEMLSEAVGKWMFIHSDIKNITEIDMRNPFNDSLPVAFLLDNIGEFVGDRGSKTVFGAMDPKELKETYARIEKGDGYFYDIESDELLKLKFIYSDELKRAENMEVI
jgi:hypothetical protein